MIAGLDRRCCLVDGRFAVRPWMKSGDDVIIGAGHELTPTWSVGIVVSVKTGT
jgi:hypothetical protein